MTAAANLNIREAMVFVGGHAEWQQGLPEAAEYISRAKLLKSDTPE
jgi:hypothetical protein